MGNWPFTFHHVLQKRLASLLDPCLTLADVSYTRCKKQVYTHGPVFLRDFIERNAAIEGREFDVFPI